SRGELESPRHADGVAGAFAADRGEAGIDGHLARRAGVEERDGAGGAALRRRTRIASRREVEFGTAAEMFRLDRGNRRILHSGDPDSGGFLQNLEHTQRSVPE